MHGQSEQSGRVQSGQQPPAITPTVPKSRDVALRPTAGKKLLVAGAAGSRRWHFCGLSGCHTWRPLHGPACLV